MDIIITLLITIIGAILSAIFMPVWYKVHKTKNIECELVASTKSKILDDVIEFYLEKIHYSERVSPSFIKFFLDSEKHNITTIKNLEIACNKSLAPKHILLASKFEGNIIGIIKIIYLCDINSFFIAYYAAKPNKNCSSSAILNSILDFLIEKIELVDNIYYEICENEEDKRESEAKSRLFKHYAESRNFSVNCIIKNYLQPEISAFDEGFLEPVPAKLYSLSRHTYIQNINSTKNALQSIFKGVYADSFYHVNNEHYEQFCEYLDMIQSDILESKL